jgi:hypothetical protein
MEKTNYRGWEITISDRDTDKCDDAWKREHWAVQVKNKPVRKQMSFDVWGGGAVKNMNPVQAFYLFILDACEYINCDSVESVMSEFGYDDYKTAKKVFKGLENAYYKCRKFGIDDDNMIDILNELQDEWG